MNGAQDGLVVAARLALAILLLTATSGCIGDGKPGDSRPATDPSSPTPAALSHATMQAPTMQSGPAAPPAFKSLDRATLLASNVTIVVPRGTWAAIVLDLDAAMWGEPEPWDGEASIAYDYGAVANAPEGHVAHASGLMDWDPPGNEEPMAGIGLSSWPVATAGHMQDFHVLDDSEPPSRVPHKEVLIAFGSKDVDLTLWFELSDEGSVFGEARPVVQAGADVAGATFGAGTVEVVGDVATASGDLQVDLTADGPAGQQRIVEVTGAGHANEAVLAGMAASLHQGTGFQAWEYRLRAGGKEFGFKDSVPVALGIYAYADRVSVRAEPGQLEAFFRLEFMGAGDPLGATVEVTWGYLDLDPVQDLGWKWRERLPVEPLGPPS